MSPQQTVLESSPADSLHAQAAIPASQMTRARYAWLVGAVLVGLLARFPGVFWGYNFPFGPAGHHPDEWTHVVNAEMLINPVLPPRWPPQPYPKGMAAHVAVPVLAIRAADGKVFVSDRNQVQNPPAPFKIIVGGRIVNVLYGTATVLLVFLLARWLFGELRVALLASWIMALGGLHVTESHFFVADVAGLFWLLLGLYLLARESDDDVGANRLHYLLGAAFCFGVGFGIKFVIVGLPTLGLIALMRRPRLLRCLYSVVFFLAGAVIINMGSYTPVDFYKTVVKGISDPYRFNRLWGLVLYLIELPSLVSLPIAVLSIVGAVLLARRLFEPQNRPRLLTISLVFVLPLIIEAGLVVFKLDHFPRHVIPFIPWIAIAAGWMLVWLTDRMRLRGTAAAVVLVPVFAYLVLFVYDGERLFIHEPRNAAARWLMKNVPPGTTLFWSDHVIPGYEQVDFPLKGRPAVYITEMHTANHYLSGMSWRDSYPRDYRHIFDAHRSQQYVDALQAVFKGTGGYREVARFPEGYFMPEYTITDRLLGNRSRNYIAEVVVFRKVEPAVAAAPTSNN